MSTWAPIENKTQTFDAVSLTVCSSESWPGSFIAGTAPSFSIKRCANPASIWALFIKRSSTNTLEKLRCCPEKTNCIHCLCNAGFFGKLNKVILPSQPKTHFFRDILHRASPVQCSRMKHVDGRALALALVDACTGAFFFFFFWCFLAVLANQLKGALPPPTDLECGVGRVFPGEMPI